MQRPESELTTSGVAAQTSVVPESGVVNPESNISPQSTTSEVTNVAVTSNTSSTETTAPVSQVKKSSLLKLDASAKPFCPSTSAPPFIPSTNVALSTGSKPFSLSSTATPYRPSVAAQPYIPTSFAAPTSSAPTEIASQPNATIPIDGGYYYEEDDYERGPDFDDDTLAIGKEDTLAYSIFYLYTLKEYNTAQPPGIPPFLDFNLAPATGGRVSASAVQWTSDDSIAKSASKIPQPVTNQENHHPAPTASKTGSASAPAGRRAGVGISTAPTSAQLAQAHSARAERAAKKKRGPAERETASSSRRKQGPYVPLALQRGGGGNIAGNFGKSSMPNAGAFDASSSLRTAENRWVPPSIKAKQEAANVPAVAASTEPETEEQVRQRQAEADAVAQNKVIKSLLSILNKLTPDNFVKLAGQALEICSSIPNAVGLRQTVRVIYEKAVSEPKYAGLYAALCAALISADPEWNIKYHADLETLRKEPNPVRVASSKDNTTSGEVNAPNTSSPGVTLHRCASIGLSSAKGDGVQTPTPKPQNENNSKSTGTFFVTAQSYVPAEYVLPDAKFKVPSFVADLSVATPNSAASPGSTVLTGVLARETFKKALLNECFKQLSNEPTSTLPSAIPPSFAIHPTDSEEEKASKQRARARGTVIFAGELFRRGMMPRHTIYYCLDTMLQSETTTTESEIEDLVSLLRTVGSVLDGDPELSKSKGDDDKKSKKKATKSVSNIFSSPEQTSGTSVPESAEIGVRTLERSATTPATQGSMTSQRPPLDNGFIRKSSLTSPSTRGLTDETSSGQISLIPPILDGSHSPSSSATGSRSTSPVIQPIPLSFAINRSGADSPVMDSPFIDAPDGALPAQDQNSATYAEALRELFSRIALDANPFVAAAAEAAAKTAQAAALSASMAASRDQTENIKFDDSTLAGSLDTDADGQIPPSARPIFANQPSISLVGASSPELGALASELPVEHLNFMMTPSPLLRARVRKQLSVRQQQEQELHKQQTQQQQQQQQSAHGNTQDSTGNQEDSPGLFPLEPAAESGESGPGLQVDTQLAASADNSAGPTSARSAQISSGHTESDDEEDGDNFPDSSGSASNQRNPLPLLIRASSEFTAISTGPSATSSSNAQPSSSGSHTAGTTTTTHSSSVSLGSLALDIGLTGGGVGVDASGRSVRFTPEQRRSLMDKYFAIIQRLITRRVPVDSRNTSPDAPTKYALDSRLRFMLQDLVDLRANRWIPRDTAPKDVQAAAQAIKAQQALAQSQPQSQFGKDQSKSSFGSSQHSRDSFMRSGHSTMSSSRSQSIFGNKSDSASSKSLSSSASSSRRTTQTVSYAHFLTDPKATYNNTPAKQFQRNAATNLGAAATTNTTASTTKSTATPAPKSTVQALRKESVVESAKDASDSEGEWITPSKSKATPKKRATTTQASPDKTESTRNPTSRSTSNADATPATSHKTEAPGVEISAGNVAQGNVDDTAHDEAQDDGAETTVMEQSENQNDAELQQDVEGEEETKSHRPVETIHTGNIPVAVQTLYSVTGGLSRLAYYLMKQMNDEKDAVKHQILLRREQPQQRYAPDRHAAKEAATLDTCEVHYAHLLLDPASKRLDGESPTSADLENTPMKQLVEEFMDTNSVEEVLRCITDLNRYFSQRLYTAAIEAVESAYAAADQQSDEVLHVPSPDLIKLLPYEGISAAERKARFELFAQDSKVVARTREWLREEGIPLVIYHCVQWAAERRPSEAQASIKLILALFDAKVVTARQLLRGVTPILWTLEGLAVDCPSAFSSVSTLLASLLLRRAIPWNSLLDVLYWVPVDMYDDAEEDTETPSDEATQASKLIECEEFISKAGKGAKLRVGAGLLHTSVPNGLRERISKRWAANPWTFKLVNGILNEMARVQGGSSEIKRMVAEGNTANVAAAATAGLTAATLTSPTQTATLPNAATEAKQAAAAASSAFAAAILAKQQAKQALAEACGGKAASGSGAHAEQVGILRLLGADLLMPLNEFKAKLEGPARLALGL